MEEPSVALDRADHERRVAHAQPGVAALIAVLATGNVFAFLPVIGCVLMMVVMMQMMGGMGGHDDHDRG